MLGEELFDLVWGAFTSSLEEPMILDDPDELVEATVFSMLVSKPTFFTFAELVKQLSVPPADTYTYILDYFTRYILGGQLPSEEEVSDAFFDKVEECEVDSMDEYMNCVNQIYYALKLAKQFALEFLPKHVRVEVVS
jgi:hypothetical protein